MKRRSIALIIPSLSHGGAERVASTLANEWASRSDLAVHVVTFSGLEDFFALAPAVRRVGIPLRPRPGPVALIVLAWRIRRYLAREKISAVLSFMDRYNVFMLVGLAGSGIRVSVSDRSNPLRRRPTWLALLKRCTYPRAAAVIAQTEQAAAEIASIAGSARVVVIPNPLTIPAGHTAVGEQRDRVVLNVGRLIEEKGQIHLVRAFAHAALTGWRLVILGDGPLRGMLEAEAVALGVRDRIELPGVMSDLAPWYARASIFALPSVSEGYPNALVEAMAHGLPCVSSDCDAGPREILTHRTDGVLVPPRDERALAEALRELAGDEQMRRKLGANARQRVETLSADRVSARYLDACLGTGFLPDGAGAPTGYSVGGSPGDV